MRTNISLIVLGLVALTTFFSVDYYVKTPDQVYVQVSQNLDRLLDEQQADIQDFENQLTVYTNPFAIPVERRFSKRVYLNGGLIYWSDDRPLAEYSALKKSDTLYVDRGEEGVQIIRRRQVIADRDLIEIFSIIPVVSVPPLTNQYLNKTYNPEIFGKYELRLSREGAYGFVYHALPLFNADIDQQKSLIREWIILILILIFGGFMVGWSGRIMPFRQAGSRAAILTVLVILLRLLLYFWTSSTALSVELFDPIYFTAGRWAPTLGDLILNGITALTLALIASSLVSGKGRVIWPVAWQYLTGALIIGGVFGISSWLYQGIWALLEHSQIELDIHSSLMFGALRLGAYLFLMVIGMTFLVLFGTAVRLLNYLTIPGWIKAAMLLGCYLACSVPAGEVAFIYLLPVLVVWLLLDLTGLNWSVSAVNYQTLIFLVLVFSVVASIFAIGVFEHHEKDTFIEKERFANKLLIKNDILGEFFLSEIIHEVSEDRYVRTRLMSKLLARQNIREKIRRQFLSPYFKKYDLDVFLFDAEGSSLQSDVSEQTYGDWQDEFARAEYATDYEHIYFVEDKNENVRNKYICFIPIAAYGRQVGYIILSLTLKKYIVSSVFPELLLESKYYTGNNEEFDYGVFKNGELLYKQGRYSFENKISHADFKEEVLYGEGIDRDGFHYFGKQTLDGRTLIIVSEDYELQAVLVNFSFIFLLLLFSCGLVFVGAGLFGRRGRFNLSTRIQLYLGLSFILPMIVVSGALLNTLNISYREEIDRTYLKRSYNISENLIDVSESFYAGEINIDDYATEIGKAAAVTQTDLNMYDVKGHLVASSQPDMFRLGLVSGLLDPKAYYKVAYKKEQVIISNQRIGKLEFKTSYTALRSYQDGRLLAILAMPYFDSKNNLRVQQVQVFGDLVVIFTFIFLISLIGGNVIVGQLVRPLKVISERIGRTSLQEENQPIHYDSDDEIGILVKEYNQMLVKLEESKAALALSQKESAWKEIARQVAHEIKNPLTPMRLKIQQMMRAFAPDSREYRTCQTLIAQIDSLSSIADSFSEFAKMPAPHNELVNLVDLVDGTVNLYHSNEVILHRDYEVSAAQVFVDPKIFSRILTNILLNAIQAVPAGMPEIIIKIKVSGNKVTLSVADNGSGISAEQREKIFTPYFSTKSRGSGIGLAVAKKGIENAGGTIWFESEEGEGTTFFISLPLVPSRSAGAAADL